MTGYGEASATCNQTVIRCRLKSVNGRGAKAKLACPFLPLSLLHTIEKMITNGVIRGEVAARIIIEDSPEKEEQDLISSSRETMERLTVIKEAIGLEGTVTVREFLDFNRAFPRRSSQDSTIEADVEAGILGVVEDALKELERSRETEGWRLEKDLLGSLEVITGSLDSIEALSGRVHEIFLERMRANLEEIQAAGVLSEDRIAAEMVVFADRCNIHEEMIRLRSHLDLFRETLSGDEKVLGKKLDFIGQEMFREITTLVGKARDAEVSQHAVDVKEHLGRMREQLRNVL